MLLAVDIGNTNLTFGLYRGLDLALTFRAETVRSRTTDEYAALLSQLAMVHAIGQGEVKAAIVASVVPQLTDTIVRAIRLAFGRDAMVVGPGTKTGVQIRYDNPHDVGADRIVNAVAAFRRVQGAAIVVDFGTATTFDCISPSGDYLGGVIVPGIQLSLDALVDRAAKLRPVEIAVPPTVVGRNTPHALQSGIVFGYASMIDGMVQRIRDELGYAGTVIATGGLAPLLAMECKTLEQVDLNLTLEGLRILYDRNAS